MMKVSNIRRALAFNLFIAIIGRSNSIECVSKATYNKLGETEQIIQLDEEEEVVECEDGETHCITATGSFKGQESEWNVKSVQVCTTSSVCESDLSAEGLAGILASKLNINIPRADYVPGSTEIVSKCCETDACNTVEMLTTTEADSGYLVNKMNFIFIVLILAFAISATFIA